MQPTSRFSHLVDTLRHAVDSIQAEDLYQLLNHSHDAFYLIDVREKEAFDQQHLPRAIHLSKGVIERDIEKIIPNVNAQIILYCNGGFLSVLAAHNLKLMGYQNVKSLAGGANHWLAKKLPSE